MADDSLSLQDKIVAIQQENAALKHRIKRGGVRKRSTNFFFGLPYYDIATGGIARGFVAIGGIALGAVSVGGCSIAILFGIGGFAVCCNWWRRVRLLRLWWRCNRETHNQRDGTRPRCNPFLQTMDTCSRPIGSTT